MFAVTEKLRKDLDTFRARHGSLRDQSMTSGLDIQTRMGMSLKSEYCRGMADGIRLAIEKIAQTMREEVAAKGARK